MMRFYVGQKWINTASNWRGEIVAISDAGWHGVMSITDEKGQTEKWEGTAAKLPGPGRWKPAA